ncbi:DUF4393 domain-containing protein [Lysinibacillus telephonicus]|uniref:DUF4393 domain-containing protein n=1 Tax=Lysinibacillus telephonicus TaxID=1714840 RepID=UPI003BA1BF69
MTEINIFPKFMDSALTPVASSVGNTLSAVWNIAFGGIDSYSQRLDHKRAVNLNQFKDELDKKVSAIPKEKLTEPPLHVIGPTFEASKFYFENRDLRSMFVSLIASSINKDKSNDVHPAFVEIIKQLHTDEAKIIEKFYERAFPLIDIRAVFQNGGMINLALNFSDIGEKVNCIAPLSIGTYIVNLERLGLISIENTELMDPKIYDELLEHPIITEARYRDDIIGNQEPIIIKKHFRVTPFGIQFYRICCEQYEHTSLYQFEE